MDNHSKNCSLPLSFARFNAFVIPPEAENPLQTIATKPVTIIKNWKKSVQTTAFWVHYKTESLLKPLSIHFVKSM